MAGALRNIRIFEDTAQFCAESSFLCDAVRKTVATQKLILENDPVPQTGMAKRDQPAEVIVSSKRTFEAAAAYKGKKTCVLNFASAVNPGGGVTVGASAQEECLCRCSTLYFSLNTPEIMEQFYLPHRNLDHTYYNDDLIYSPDVWVVKTDEDRPARMVQADWYPVNVITCAAPNLAGFSHISIEDLYALHKKRIRRIFDVAAAEGNDVLILGAFGCGAFCNPPDVVAMAFRSVMKDYRDGFDVIEYAVYCSDRGKVNYKVFRSNLI